MTDIIVPVYREEETIKTLLDGIENDVKSGKRVIAVYDFDEDETVKVLRKIKGHYSFEILIKKNNYGKGVLNAVRTGFEEAKGEAAVVVMADLSDSLEDVDVMKKMIDTGVDIVCASRYAPGGRHEGGPPVKKLLSYAAGLSLNYLIKIPTRDITNNFRMYSRKVIENITIESTVGFCLAMELTIKAYVYGMKVAEIPTVWRNRVTGKSKFKMLKWLPEYLRWYFYGIYNIIFK
jgi:glycosyltransferase involved in cell wall biosynthesis